MLFTVSTVKDTVPGLKQFVARNLAGGVDHMFLFVDDARPRVTAALNRHPHVTAIATGESWWVGKRPRQLNARQRINANVVKALLLVDAGADDWLFHIDGDEALQVDRAALAALPPDVSVVNARPLEAVSRKKWPKDEVTHFKRMLKPDELTLLHVLGVIDEPSIGRYFHGHVEGKSGLRPTLDRWITLHAVHDVDQEQVPSSSEGGVARLLHYESWSGEEFVRKWTNILESGTKVSFRPGREPTAVALRTLLEADLPERRLRDYLMRIFERTTEDDFETLRRPRPPRAGRPARGQAPARAADRRPRRRDPGDAGRPRAREQVALPHRPHLARHGHQARDRRRPARGRPRARRAGRAGPGGLDAARGAAQDPGRRPTRQGRATVSGPTRTASPSSTSPARQRARCPESAHTASRRESCTGPSLSRRTAISRPRHWRSVPAHAWVRRAGPSYAG